MNYTTPQPNPHTNFNARKPNTPPGKVVSAMTELASFPRNLRIDNLNPDEQILLFIRKDRIILVFNIIAYTFVLFLPLFIRLTLNWINTSLLNSTINLDSFFSSKYWTVINIIWLAYMLKGYFNIFFKWFYDINILTNNRFMDIDFLGIFSQRTEETSVLNIEDAKDSQKGIIQSLFNMGNLEILTASGATVFSLDNVPKSNKIRDFIMDIVVAAKNENNNKRDNN